MTGISSITVPLLDGRLVTATTHEWAVDGVVTRGIAEATRPGLTITDPNGPKMPVLFIADNNKLARGQPNRRELVPGARGKDDFVFVKGATGPVNTMVHVVDGKLDQAYSFEWKRVKGGWLAMAFTVTIFKNGKPLAKIRSARKGLTAPTGVSFDEQNSCIFDVKQFCDGPPVLSGIDGGGGGGSGPCNCNSELQDYLAAAFALASATQAAIDSGAIAEPWIALGLIGGAAYVGILLMRYQACYQECQKYVAGARELPLRSLLFAPIERHYLRPA
jgi:hypothetical protein